MLKTVLLRGGALAAAALCALTLPAGADDYRGQRGNYGYDRQGGVVLYSNAGFSGEGISVNGAVPNLSQLRFNDRASSIVIHSGAWEVCVDSNFRGRCEIIDSSMSHLNAYRLNDNISSLRPAAYGNSRDWNWGDGRPGRGGHRAGLTLYADARQNGQGIEISHDVPDLSDYRFNDRASSFFVSGGTWLACEHANYRGRCDVLTRGAGDLKPIRLNDNISSVRRYDGRGDDRWR